MSRPVRDDDTRDQDTRDQDTRAAAARDARHALEAVIASELCRYPTQVAQRMLTRRFAEHPALGDEDRQALRTLLDARIDACECPAAPRGGAVPDIARQRAPRLPFDPARIEAIVADALSAPTDGSVRRFKVLCARAHALLDHAMAGHGVGGFQAWRLRLRLRAALRRERPGLVRPRRD